MPEAERRPEGISLRPLLELLCDQSGEFGLTEFRDFTAAKEQWRVLAVNSPRSLGQELQQLDRIGSWHAFYRALSGGIDLFAGALDVGQFLSAWDRMWGFDMNGLLEAGTPRTGADATATDGLLATHLLGRRFLASDDATIACIRTRTGAIRDNHVHFGQIADIGLLWHAQLRSRHCTWRLFHPRMPSSNGKFEEVLRAKARIDDWHAMPQMVNSMTEHRAFQWGSRLARCRLLLFYFEMHENRNGHWATEAPIRFLEDVLAADAGWRKRHTQDDTDTLGSIEHESGGMLEDGRARSLAHSIDAERRLLGAFAAAESAGAGPADRNRSTFAAAYLAIKNVAFSTVSSNNVNSFEKFSHALKVLQEIYEQDSRLFQPDAGFVAVTRAHMAASGSFPADVRFALRPKALTEPMNPIGRQWKTAARISESGTAAIVIALHRSDLEHYHNRDAAFVEDALKHIPELERKGHGRVVGLDLIGSEVGNDRTDPNVSGEYLFASFDVLLQLRKNLSKQFDRPLFVTLHCGEHVTERALGILAFAAIMTDPGLQPTIDRFSHALILTDNPLQWSEPQASVTTARDAARGRLQRNLRGGQCSLFKPEAVDDMLAAADTLNENPGDGPAFTTIQRMLREVIERGDFQIEVCPYSNKMIRQAEPTAHPWSASIGKANILIGTDDPSLTQTQPWMEAASFYHRHCAARR